MNITIEQCSYIIRDWLYKESTVDKFTNTHKKFLEVELKNLPIIDIDYRCETKNRSLFLHIIWKCQDIVADLMNANKLEFPYEYIFNSMKKLISDEIKSSTPKCLYTFFYSMVKFIGQYTNNLTYYNTAYDLMAKCIPTKDMYVNPMDTLYLFNFNANFKRSRLVNMIPKKPHINRLYSFIDSGIIQKNSNLEELYDAHRLNYAYKNFIVHNDKISFAYLLDSVISRLTVEQKSKPISELYNIFVKNMNRNIFEDHYKSFIETICDKSITPVHIFGFTRYLVLIEPNMIVSQKLNLLQKNQDNKNELKSILNDAITVSRESYIKYIEFLDKQHGPLLIDIRDAVFIKLLMKICNNNYLTENDYDEYIYLARTSANDVIAKYLLFHKKKHEYNLDSYPLELYSTKYFTTDIGTNCNQIINGPVFLNLPDFVL